MTQWAQPVHLNICDVASTWVVFDARGDYAFDLRHYGIETAGIYDKHLTETI